MIRINKYGGLNFNKVAYLSFNSNLRSVESRKKSINLLIELTAGIYHIHSDGELMLRKITIDDDLMEYVYLNRGTYNFIDATVPHRLILLDK